MGLSDPSTMHGFTHFELLIVIAVTALMGAVGVSAWHTYAIRAEVSQTIALAQPARAYVTRAFRRNGIPPADASSVGLATGTTVAEAAYAAEITIVNGRIDLIFGANASDSIAGGILSLTPFETADQQVVWICGNQLPGVGLKPLGFAGGLRQAVQASTTIDSRYLPRACR